MFPKFLLNQPVGMTYYVLKMLVLWPSRNGVHLIFQQEICRIVMAVSYGGSIDSTVGPPLFWFDSKTYCICRTTANYIITFDLFLREQQHLGRRIPEEEQLCSFELFFSFCFVCQMGSERCYKKSQFKKNLFTNYYPVSYCHWWTLGCQILTLQ